MVRLDLDIQVTATDGELASSGPATLSAERLGEPLAGLYFSHVGPTLGSTASAEVASRVPTGATPTEMVFESHSAGLGLSVGWDEPDTVGSAVVYQCTHTGARNPATTDWLHMSAP